ncbi:MAG: ATP-binding protein, partial [Yoonia sp.]|uniref:ATP-binding protein n=1 Tax=Yoonia sp. TaxID=2212373 RepID=UPI003EF34C81
DHSKIEAGQVALEQAWFPLDDLLDDVLAQTRALMAGKTVRLMTNYGQNLPRYICSDPLRLRQIITNLASNAVKFTLEGEIVLCARCVQGADDMATLTFCVRDSGIGIAQGQIDEIFKPFGQADSSTTRQFGGTGLGLSIAHGLASQMHGKLDVESTAGKGSCFSFEVTVAYRNDDQDALNGQSVNITGDADPMCPIRKIAVRTGYALGDENADFSIAVSTQSARFFAAPKPDVIVEELALPITHREFIGALRGLNKIGSAPLTTFIGKDVLIVEDNRINQSVFVSLVRALGAKTRTAQNGLEAVEQVANAMPDAILMDLHMPLMDGYAALDVLMAAHGRALAPVVATSANATSEEDRACKAAGFVDFLPKPVDPEKLKTVLETAISHATPIAGLDRARGLVLAGNNETLYEQNLIRFRKSLSAWSKELADLARIPNPHRLAELLHVIKGAAGTLAADRLARQAAAVEKDSKSLGALQVGIADLLKEIGDAPTTLAITPEKSDISLNALLDRVRARDVSSLDVARGFMAADDLNDRQVDYPALIDALERLDFIAAEKILIARRVPDQDD